MTKGLLTLTLSVFLTVQLFSIEKLERVEPMFWWTGMQNPDLQLLVYGDNIGHAQVKINYPGIQLKKVHKVENANYLFIDLSIDKNTKPGMFTIKFTKNNKEVASYDYKLLPRNNKKNIHKGFDASDVVYLLMPDRFANGNPENDSMKETLEKADRSNPNGRHGGDLQGIINNLDYLQNRGATALWLNPFLENNMPNYSYHGYAITDFYNTDPRHGNNALFVDLIDEAHKHGLKMIMDMIFNHCGTNHWFIKDLPMSDWIHQHKEFTRTNYRAPVVADPYKSEYDYNKMLKGWFDVTMADLNQNNPYLSRYFTQNTIWWIEYSGLDGIRVDTQPYPYKEFMAQWTQAIMEEYPTFNIVGEAWLQKIPITSYFQKSSTLSGDYNSFMPCITDFPMYFAISKAFNEKEGWTEGMNRLYYILAQDFAYADPNKLLTFCDNHDLNRYVETVQHDIAKYKMGLVFLMTTRGIPQIYYGTEIFMDGEEHKGHGDIRKDFPGGWANDKANAFTSEGRNKEQNEAFNFLSNLLNWRKYKKVIHSGKLKHFLPENNVYTYFRYNDTETVMVVINSSERANKVKLDRFKEVIGNRKKGVDIISKTKIKLNKTLEVPAKTAMVIEIGD